MIGDAFPCGYARAQVSVELVWARTSDGPDDPAPALRIYPDAFTCCIRVLTVFPPPRRRDEPVISAGTVEAAVDIDRVRR
jgi:hypothetical protein